ncbi:MAG: hypothetical protein WC384_19160 [Prolixibacteraceae bacterium]|jgi:hypothetical protein
MKKILSISFALLILVSGLNFTISTHYCGGKVAASKISLYGHLASCGMEESETDDCTYASTIEESSCCKNKVSVYEVDHNYSPSFTEFKVFAQTVLQLFTIPENITFHSLTSASNLYTDVSPPGFLPANAVSLPKICVFRI